MNDPPVETLPEAVRDLDLMRQGFEEQALGLGVQDFQNLIKRSDIKCESEDQVFDLSRKYIDKA